MPIQSAIKNLHSTLPENVSLVAVSKTKPVSDILEAYEAGQRIFGENKVQEMCEKQPQLPNDIQWHLIGHLQTNKVKYMAHFVKLIHGVDSLKLLREIDKQAKKHNRIIDCLLQIYIAEEETKFGLSEEEFAEIINSEEFKKLQNIKVVGLMGMATYTEIDNQIRKEFAHLKAVFDKYKSLSTFNFQLSTLSMGMSGDYPIAVECGSTMVRIGSNIFGNR
ncbi:MAG: YggS family pyridoxal phosphate-dependent enzyme [Flavobacteriaceae bacterium]